MLLHAEYQKDGLGKPLGCQLFVLLPWAQPLLHVGLRPGIRESGPSKGGTWRCSNCSRAAKQNPVGGRILTVWCPAHPTMTETAARSEMREAVPPFFYALTFQFFADIHTAFEVLCHREMIKIQSSVKVWGTIFLSFFPKHLLSPFQILVLPVQHYTIKKWDFLTFFPT